MSQLNTI